MKAYKCDVCGKFCDAVFNISDDTFDIFPYDAMELGIEEKHITIRDMCTNCYCDIKSFIHSKYMDNHYKAGGKNDD